MLPSWAPAERFRRSRALQQCARQRELDLTRSLEAEREFSRLTQRRANQGLAHRVLQHAKPEDRNRVMLAE